MFHASYAGLVLKTLVQKAAGWAGYEVRRKPSPAGTGAELDPVMEPLAAALATVRPYTMLSNARLVTLHRQVQHLDRRGVKGALVECGTWKGGAVGMMAIANRDSGAPPRDLHLFDAFDDICEPDPAVDGQRILDEVRATLGITDIAGRLRPLAGAYARFGGHGTIEDARRLLVDEVGHDPRRVCFHEGWFQDTVPVDAAAIGDIALLRLDGDLYASIKVCLEHLFAQVVPGGFVVIDDYGYYDGCTRAVDEFIATNGLDAYLHPADHVAQCHVYWIKH